MLSAALLCLFALAQGAILQSEEYSNSPQVSWMDEVKVPVVLGVMSRCPDAILCESVWDTVLQQVGNKVDISLSFIGRCAHSRPVRDFGINVKIKAKPTRQNLWRGLHAWHAGVRRKRL